MWEVSRHGGGSISDGGSGRIVPIYAATASGRTGRLSPTRRCALTALPPPPQDRLRGLLRTPLTWKLLTPWLLGSAGVVAWALLSGAEIDSIPMLAGLVVLFAGWGTAAVRFALVPLRSLAETAHRVTAGDEGARAPRSPLSDPEMAHLIETFNTMLDALADERARRQSDAGWLVEAEERQRERVAHELFAGPAQTLAGVLVRLKLLYRQLEDSPPAEAAGELVDEVRAALEEIQTLARRLRPPELAELGTHAAIQALARRLEASYGVEVAVEGAIPDERLAPAARAALFRIVEDALADLVHAPPTRPTTLFFRTDDDVLVADLHLPPFPPAARPDAPPERNGRWRVVGHRAQLVGGRMHLDHVDGGEVHLRIELPLTPAPQSGGTDRGTSARPSGVPHSPPPPARPVSPDPQESHGP